METQKNEFTEMACKRYQRAWRGYEAIVRSGGSGTLFSYCESVHVNYNGMKQWVAARKIVRSPFEKEERQDQYRKEPGRSVAEYVRAVHGAGSRSENDILNELKGYQGTIQSDGLKAYKKVAAQSNGRILRLSCGCKHRRTSTSQNRRCAGAVNYFLNEWDGIEAIATGGDYAWDNNLIERINRHISLSGKNSLFFGSHAGAGRGASSTPWPVPAD